MKFLKSLFTDGEWDGDITKVLGFCIVIAGVVGWFKGLNDVELIIGFGATLAASGKFSKQG